MCVMVDRLPKAVRIHVLSSPALAERLGSSVSKTYSLVWPEVSLRFQPSFPTFVVTRAAYVVGLPVSQVTAETDAWKTFSNGPKVTPAGGVMLEKCASENENS